MPVTEITAAPVQSTTAYPLRQALLHPDRLLEFSIYPADEAASTLHVGAFAAGALVGIASVYHESPPAAADAGAWRLRDMGVAESMRRRGCGSLLLRACLEHVAAQGGSQFWCNARPTAVPFYLAHDFRLREEAFVLPGFGPRYFMWRAVGVGRNPVGDARGFSRARGTVEEA
jgi:GNAT superfamily N-acetyltransferase